MKRPIIALFLCLLMTASMASPLNKIIVFGDSASDTSNFYIYTKHQVPESPPYHKGRFSNGPLWIDYVLAHYYASDVEGHHLNYAFVGSAVGDEKDDEDEYIEEIVTPYLGLQLKRYFREHADKADPDSLYVVWIASNNYAEPEGDADEQVRFVLSGIKRSLGVLVEKGAKHIMVIGVVPLGDSPKAHQLGMIDLFTYLSAQHNMKLLEEVEKLRVLYPDINWVYFDVSLLLSDIAHHPDRYGFTNVLDECINILSACDTYSFFDEFMHFTTKMHAYIAQAVIEELDKAGLKFG